MSAVRYSAQQLEQLEHGRDEWVDRAESLLDKVISTSLSVERARDFATQGFGRRLGYLRHALNRIYEILPPNYNIATRSTVRDAELIIQAFVMNVFGSIDNLAWIWALERHIVRSNGEPLKRSEMVFDQKRSPAIWTSLTAPILDELLNNRNWFEALGNYRHGVAHQIPIYIPLLYSKDEIIEFNQLNFKIQKAVSELDHKTLRTLIDQQNNLGSYGPVMALTGDTQSIKFHVQMIADVATVVSLGEKIFDELCS